MLRDPQFLVPLRQNAINVAWRGRARRLHSRLARSGGELSVTCAPDSDAGTEAPQSGIRPAQQPVNSGAPASGKIKPQPRIVTLYRLRLRQAARERHIRSQTNELP